LLTLPNFCSSKSMNPQKPHSPSHFCIPCGLRDASSSPPTQRREHPIVIVSATLSPLVLSHARSTPLPHHCLPSIQISNSLQTDLERCTTSLIVHLHMLKPGCWEGSEGGGMVVCPRVVLGGRGVVIRPRNSPSYPAGPGSLLGRSRPGQGPLCPSPSWYRIWTDCRRLPGPPGPCRAPH